MNETAFAAQLAAWLRADAQRLAALQAAASLNLPDWCLAAGFVRNLVWDRLHDHPVATPLADIDLIYWNPDCLDPDTDAVLEQRLRRMLPLPWSVKNQARMHVRNGDAPYQSSCDAMSYWVERETAVGAWLRPDGELRLLAPFGLAPLQNLNITLNAKRPKPEAFAARIATKRWLAIWPRLRVVGPDDVAQVPKT
ncbi:nucleotidyltransferase family protein [Jeongeupia chitinilytica]|uniref:Nitrate reductase n=1 Tax=Jeongeupia chitinilytica TaxID=1041641 RepID=A0ABQ3H5R3_9NEIS|nr:nucleotidyltransferase family protein [Jeongeupia chitinilytica]GHD67493.1 nitrate reductase [Jeongeupia chitinilytica]